MNLGLNAGKRFWLRAQELKQASTTIDHALVIPSSSINTERKAWKNCLFDRKVSVRYGPKLLVIHYQKYLQPL